MQALPVASPSQPPALRLQVGQPNLHAYRMVTVDAMGRAIHADAGNRQHAGITLGMTLTAALENDLVTVRRDGPVHNAGWNFPAPCRLYLGLDGHLTADSSVGVFCQCVGSAISRTDVVLNIEAAVLRSQ